MMPLTCGRTSAERKDSKRPGSSVLIVVSSAFTVSTLTTSSGAPCCCCCSPLLQADSANTEATAIALSRKLVFPDMLKSVIMMALD